MDTNRLQQLRVLAETKNLRRAAELLGISHTGLHKSMRRLEEELGQDLFRVVGRGLELTPFAQSILQKIPQIIAQVEALRMDVAPMPNLFTLGSFEVFTTHALPTFARQLNDVNFSLRELGPGRLEEAVLKGDVDIGVTYNPIARAGLEIYSVSPVKMGLFGRRKTFEKTKFDELPFVAPILPLNETPTTVRGLDGWPDHKAARKIVYSVELMESALALLREGLAVAYLPRFVVALHNRHVKDASQIGEIALPPKFPGALKHAYIVKRQLQKENHFERRVAKGLRALCGAE